MRFEELDIPEKVLEGIRAAGFFQCTPVQELTLPVALQGRDIAAQAQTGTGKTAAFLVAVFSRMHMIPSPGHRPSPRALVIAPTRELVVQIEAEAKVLGDPAGFRIMSVYGGVDYLKQRDQLARGTDMLVGTPGRLIDYLRQEVYSLKKTQFLVIDEADRLFDMGFISDVRFLLRRMSPYKHRQSMLFSATLSHRVLELGYEHMNNPELFKVSPGQVTVERVEQEIYHVGRAEKFGLLLGILRRDRDGRYLIFCNRKSTADRVNDLLNANGFVSAALTGDLPQNKRLKVLSQFREGGLQVLVATDVASRGLHIEGTTHVINFELPEDVEDYVHRIGRTARAGAGGKAISLACEDYVFSLPDIEEYIRQKIPVAPVTEEMVVTGYRRARGYEGKKGVIPAGRESGAMRGKERHMRRTGRPGGQEKAGHRHPEGRKPPSGPPGTQRTR
ncbi:MAG TPA: DEAD/DEAH box helicase [Thermodesulfovibrionales bacterium]|nr:DEAD/DEAH box helicase [Thermodesulfovibrionales bacterium]